MCDTCGCDDGTGARYTRLGGSPPGEPHTYPHEHSHEHSAEAGPAGPHTVVLEQRVLARNDDLAAGNRRELTDRGVVAINLMSSPGSGKTTLLERTIAELAPRRPIGVL